MGEGSIRLCRVLRQQGGAVYSFNHRGGRRMKFGPWVCLALVWLATAQGNPPSDKSEGVLLVIEKGAQSLAIVDPIAGKLVASIPEGSVTGHEVAAAADGQF